MKSFEEKSLVPKSSFDSSKRAGVAVEGAVKVSEAEGANAAYAFVGAAGDDVGDASDTNFEAAKAVEGVGEDAVVEGMVVEGAAVENTRVGAVVCAKMPEEEEELGRATKETNSKMMCRARREQSSFFIFHDYDSEFETRNRGQK